MSIRNTMLALAALASLAGTALAPTSASALNGHGFGGGLGHGPVITHGSRFHFDHRFPIGGRYHFQHRFPNWGGYRYWPRWSSYRYWPRYDYRRFHRPIEFGGAGGVGGVAPAAMMASASAPASGPTGGCLTKQYAPDGTVIFKDRCTNEEGIGEAPGAMPQGPQTR